MRTPFRWTLPGQSPLQVLCTCCALWGAPAAVAGTPEQVTPAPVVSTPAPAAAPSTPKDNTARTGGVDRRVLTLLAMACLVGMIAGWTSGGPREPRVRLLTKPKKTEQLSVLVPPGPTPRLIPSDSPNATRARPGRAPVPRQTPAGTSRSGIVDYIAPFTDAAKTSGEGRLDYLLESDDSVEEPLDPAGSR
jgi:hypothetical protein